MEQNQQIPQVLKKKEQEFIQRAAPVCDTWEELKEAHDLQFPDKADKISVYIIWSWCSKSGVQIRNPDAIPPKLVTIRKPSARRAVYADWLVAHAPEHNSWDSLTEACNTAFGEHHNSAWTYQLAKRAGVTLEFGPGFRHRSKPVGPPKKKKKPVVVAPGEKKRPAGSTLCEFCVNAVPNHSNVRPLRAGQKPRGCNWSMHLKPVDGWTIKNEGVGHIRVLQCPEFIDDMSWCK